MKITLYVIACIALTAIFVACNTPPQGTYSAEQVQQGLKDAVGQHVISQPQADAVAGKIASAETGFDWAGLGGKALTVATTLALGYVGISRGSNKHIIGAEEAQALAELVEARGAAA